MQMQYRILVSAILGIALLLIVCSTTKPAANGPAEGLMLFIVFAAGATAGLHITSKNF